MEFPGVITYTDRLVFRDLNPSPEKVCTLGMVIAHELSHMWFGNYVTMKWWNGLWLNESFADFTCYLALNTINPKLGFETVDSWSSFLLRVERGYVEDQRDTTHPISCCVINTSMAESIFDGITYSKGAKVLKQLYHIIGHQRFSDNMASYFKKYAFGNTEVEDFITEISKGLDPKIHGCYDMKRFTREWL